MTDTISIVCGGCGISVDTPRCETDPIDAVKLTGVLCGDCGCGAFDMPVFENADGVEVHFEEPTP